MPNDVNGVPTTKKECIDNKHWWGSVCCQKHAILKIGSIDFMMIVMSEQSQPPIKEYIEEPRQTLGACWFCY
jgi:hypothetical protein